MPALEAGVRAPEINLPTLDGKEFSLNQALKRGPAVFAFFKTSCPVCQLAFPYLERIYKAYNASGKFTFVGVSQHKASATKDSNSGFRVSFPTLMHDTTRYSAS